MNDPIELEEEAPSNMDTSEVPEEVKQEFEDSLNADVERWVSAIRDHIEEYDSDTASD